MTRGRGTGWRLFDGDDEAVGSFNGLEGPSGNRRGARGVDEGLFVSLSETEKATLVEGDGVTVLG